jgi:Putative peptidoglycan binding domain/Caspase domain
MRMTRRLRLALGGIAAAAAWATTGPALVQTSAAQTAPARLALVIGNGAYALAPALPACVASANLVTARLKATGFDVESRADATNGGVGAALTNFAQAVAAHPGAALVVYVCGYAVNFRDRDFVLPVSATLTRPSDVLTEGVVARAFGATAGGAQAGPALVLLDVFALPTPGATAPTGTLAQESTNGRLAVGVALEPPGPVAATPAATALATLLGETEVKLPGLIGHLQSLMPSGGTNFVGQEEATADLLLVGEPARPPAALALAPAPAPASAPAPAPAAAPTPTTAAPPALTPSPLPPVAAEAAPQPPAPPAAPASAPPTATTPVPPPSATPTPPPSPAPAAAAPAPASIPPTAPPPPTRPPLPNEAMMTQANRRDVQIALARLGYYDGRIDGTMGPDTRAAIRRWQHEIGAEMTGTLTGALATRLVQQH